MERMQKYMEPKELENHFHNIIKNSAIAKNIEQSRSNDKITTMDLFSPLSFNGCTLTIRHKFYDEGKTELNIYLCFGDTRLIHISDILELSTYKIVFDYRSLRAWGKYKCQNSNLERNCFSSPYIFNQKIDFDIARDELSNIFCYYQDYGIFKEYGIEYVPSIDLKKGTITYLFILGGPDNIKKELYKTKTNKIFKKILYKANEF